MTLHRPLSTILAVLPLLLGPGAALAQPALKTPITIVLPLAPGDAADTALRTMSEDLSKQLQVPVTVSNRPGAGGSIGVQAVIAGKKDGSMLLFTQNGPLTVRRVLEPQAANYDPARDLTPLGLSTRTPSVLVVRKEAPFNSFRDLVDAARKAPGAVRIGNAGAGSAGDVSVQTINALTGSDITSVPYKGAAPAVTDVLGGQVEGIIVALGAVSTHIKSGALKAMAISSRFPELPGVPTLAELGYKQDILGVWLAFFAPAGVPPEVVQALVPALERAARNPATVAQLQALGILQDWLPPQRLAAEIVREHDAVADIVRQNSSRKP
jgi:tripartite-type tricarboxylate transporter receptor subunit TctC